jgi:hypothetical protein
VASGQARARTVLVRLRSMMSRALCRPMARRLLVIGGIALGGWLLGSAGQAHAETGPASVADPTRVVAAVPDEMAPELPRPDGMRRPGGTVTDRPVDRATRAVKAHHGGFGGFVRGVAAPVRAPGLAGLPGTVEQVVADAVPAVGGGAGSDAHWSAQHHDGAVAGAAEWAAAVPTGDPSAAAAAVRDGSAQFRAGSADPASQPGFPRGTVGQTVAPPSAGSVLSGGAAGYPARLGAMARPPAVLASVLDAVPPAVHTATDEPALSPD